MSQPPRIPANAESRQVQETWRQLRAELEQELLGVPSQPADETLARTAAEVAAHSAAKNPRLTVPLPIDLVCPANSKTKVSIERVMSQTVPFSQPAAEVMPDEGTRAAHVHWLQQTNEAAARQRSEQQLRFEAELAKQRTAFQQDLTRQRAAFEHELAEREAIWNKQRDEEWTSLQRAKALHEATGQQLQQELAAQRVQERDELHDWRRRAEAELAEARRLFEQERLKQQTEFTRQRDQELQRLQREREEFDAQVRQARTELALAKQKQDDELRQARAIHTAQVQAERADLERTREAWLDKFRREQVVLENGLRFFEQHLSRVSDELHTAQRGLQAVSLSAGEVRATIPFPAVSTETTAQVDGAGEPTILPFNKEAARPMTLEEVRDRLEWLRQPDQTQQRRAA